MKYLFPLSEETRGLLKTEILERNVPEFNEMEKLFLSRFFSNHDKNVFFMFGLPEEMITSILARYSRIKNPRGVRGLFVDDFIPLLAGIIAQSTIEHQSTKEEIQEHYVVHADRLLKVNTYLDHFLDPKSTKEAKEIAKEYLVGEWSSKVLDFFNLNSHIYTNFVSPRTIKNFLSQFLDAYGHNSIARVGITHLCLENVSTIAAKAVERARPGVGFIELSTRFVEMSAKGLHDFRKIFSGERGERLYNYTLECMSAYSSLTKELTSHYEKEFGILKGIHGEAKFNAFIFGKVCDELGNLLPVNVLTSVGISAQGEALASLVKHLYKDRTIECWILGDAILEESERTGCGLVFLGHARPTQWDVGKELYPDPKETDLVMLAPCEEEKLLHNALVLWNGENHSGTSAIDFVNMFNATRFDEQMNNPDPKKRSKEYSYEKAHRIFEMIGNIGFRYNMSYRSWRDISRMGMSTHFRSLVTPYVGMHMCNTLPSFIVSRMQELYKKGYALYTEAIQEYGSNAAYELQYMLMMGNQILGIISHNLRQAEFVHWQRSDWSVHYEVRDFIIECDDALLDYFPTIWPLISRTDRVPRYVSARGIELPRYDWELHIQSSGSKE